jgi:hypothetical protein
VCSSGGAPCAASRWSYCLQQQPQPQPQKVMIYIIGHRASGGAPCAASRWSYCLQPQQFIIYNGYP